MPTLATPLRLTIRSRHILASIALIPVALAFTGCGGDPLVSVELWNRTGGACDSTYVELRGTFHLFNTNVPNDDSGITGGCN